MEKGEMRQMLIEYMGKGFLENIIAMFKADPSLYEFISDMLADENIRVRLGTAALVEELARERPDDVKRIAPAVAELLRHEQPNLRGDAAYVLGVIKDPRSTGPLEEALGDANPDVREAAQEALEDIRRSNPEQ